MAKTVEEWIKHHLEYDPQTGLLWWKRRKQGRKMKVPAGSLTQEGYRALRIDGRHFLQHRIIWWLHTNNWPTGVIDHINGNRSDNRIENLRDVDDSVNAHNTDTIPKHKESPFPRGLRHRPEEAKPWQARIRILGNDLCKSFFTADEALQWLKEKREQAR